MFSVPSRNPDIPVYGDNGKLNAYVRTTPQLPVGVDMAAPYGGDAVILQLAIDYQEHYPYHLDVPTEL